MPRNEEGEFELVLGNRQLLSVFFVIVILMGVCFAVGYVFGRNSGSASDAARAKKGPESTIVIDPTAEGKGGAERPSLAPGQVEVRGGAPVVAAKPAPSRPRRRHGGARGGGRPPPAKPVTEPVKPAAAPARPASVAGSGLVQPEPGQTYLQVAAVRRPDADTLVSELRKKEFSASVTAGPNETLFRVVVGPLKDAVEVNKQRARLKELGFDPMVKRF